MPRLDYMLLLLLLLFLLLLLLGSEARKLNGHTHTDL